MRRHHLYTAAFFAWALLVAGAMFAVISGQFEPWLTVSTLPGPQEAIFGAAVIVIAIGWIGIMWHAAWSWGRVARAAGFPQSSTSLWPPTWVRRSTHSGTVDGRPVRARVEQVRVGYSDGTPDNETYTIVETDLDDEPDVGVEIRRSENDRLVTRDGPNDLADAVLTPQVRERLLATDSFGSLVVGDTAESDAKATVGIRSRNTLYDADELDRRARAVVAAAESFESARQARRAAATPEA